MKEMDALTQTIISEKEPWKSVTSCKVTLIRGCFS